MKKRYSIKVLCYCSLRVSHPSSNFKMRMTRAVNIIIGTTLTRFHIKFFILFHACTSSLLFLLVSHPICTSGRDGTAGTQGLRFCKDIHMGSATGLIIKTHSILLSYKRKSLNWFINFDEILSVWLSSYHIWNLIIFYNNFFYLWLHLRPKTIDSFLMINQQPAFNDIQMSANRKKCCKSIQKDH